MTTCSRRDFGKYVAALGATALVGGIPDGGSPDADYRSGKEGRAYGFFDCPASQYDIENELPGIRKSVHTPQDVKLALWDGEAPEVREPRKAAGRFRYVLEARYQGKTSREAARELAYIFNQAVHSPLYGDEPFRGRVAYREGREWEFIDEEGIFSEPE